MGTHTGGRISCGDENAKGMARIGTVALDDDGSGAGFNGIGMAGSGRVGGKPGWTGTRNRGFRESVREAGEGRYGRNEGRRVFSAISDDGCGNAAFARSVHDRMCSNPGFYERRQTGNLAGN